MKLSYIQKNKKNILEILRILTDSPNRRLQLYAYMQRLFWWIKYPPKRYQELVEYQSFAPSNFCYGHEYWLKRYSGYHDKIYAHIEHGVYFGNNKAKVSNEEEWELGNIISFGESRVKLLYELYPDYNVFQIGPRIHYAETDKEYYEELYSKIDHQGKVLTLFPAHSLATEKSLYDSNLFLSQAEELANKMGAKTIMVSLHPSDYIHQINLSFKDKKVILVGGGNDSYRFLPRLRAILELSDATFSNALGTHVGYSIYMGIPHVMNLKSNHNVDANTIFEQEQKMFASRFNGVFPLAITEEQRNLCDYYWGISKIKSPQEIFDILSECKRKYESIYNVDDN